MARPSALVVDDDPLVRRAIARQLATTFTVFVAGTMTSALKTLEQLDALGPSEQVDLAFVDYELPDGTGLPILERLEAWPDTVRLLMSANLEQLSRFRSCGKLVPLVLAKPLTFATIEAAKNAALAISAGKRILN
ncbi:MAG TPA: response regulator [Polyangiaceae bacterium]|nr:response regulator [Polyangiaceae bacterium]